MKTSVNIDGKILNISASLTAEGVTPPTWDRNSLNNEFKINLNCDGQKTSFKFYDSNFNYLRGVIELSETDLKSAASCFYSDAIAGAESYTEFCSEMGYEEESRTAKKIYNACKKSTVKAERLGIDLYEAANILNE